MKMHICDICHKNKADARYKIKYSEKWYLDVSQWTSYKKLDVCRYCGEKLMSATNDTQIENTEKIEE